MNETTVTTPNELEIRVERVFDAPRTHVFSMWTDPQLIPEWWGDGTVVEEMDLRPGGSYRFSTAFGVVEGEFREVEPPERLVQTFMNHLQTLEFEDLGEQTKLTQTMRFATTEERDTTMQYGVEEGAKSGFARVDALLNRLELATDRVSPRLTDKPFARLVEGRLAMVWLTEPGLVGSPQCRGALRAEKLKVDGRRR
jgi:uncharacterized protein YndB with AHSA1/START domain